MVLGDRWNYREPECSALSFRNMDKIFWTRDVRKSNPLYELRRSERPLDLRYVFEDREMDFRDYGKRTSTTGLVVLQGDEILHEEYGRGATEDSRFVSFSLAKVITSTLVGIALAEGRIRSLEDPVTDYLTELRGTGYEGVSIKASLQMCSGVYFVEKYGAPDSDLIKILSTLSEGGDLKSLLRMAVREREPGKLFHYSSNESQLLAWLLTEVTGETVSSYMEKKLWGPLGVESDGYFVIDQDKPDGMEAVFMGFNAMLRDYARFGLLMACDGVWRGERILPEGWVAEATIPDCPHLDHGQLHPSSHLGFQYQWWSAPGEDHTFMSHGGWGQFLLVNPALGLVMVKLSNWPQLWVRSDELETYVVFEAIESELRRSSAQT